MEEEEEVNGSEQDEDLEAQFEPLLARQRNLENHSTSYESIASISQESSSDGGSTEPSCRQKILGFTLTILAGLSFTTMNAMVKKLPLGSSWQILFLRCLIQGLCMLPLVIRSGAGIFGSEDVKIRWRVVISGGMGAFLLLAVFEAVSRIPLGDCTAIFFCSPGVTMIFSLFILREHCGIWRVLVATTSLAGVVVVCRPPGLFPVNPGPNGDESGGENDRINPVGLVWAFSTPIVGALMDILTRQASHVHFSVFVLWFGLAGLCVSTGGLMSAGVLPYQNWDTRDWLLGFGASLAGIIGRVLFTVALAYITPNQVHVVLCLEVVFAYIIQVSIFDDPVFLTSIVGAVTIVGAVVAMTFEGKLREMFQSRFI